ncbi:MAG: hypothetical protein ACXWR1_05625, partial [Bdellovibrionota bacterium]
HEQNLDKSISDFASVTEHMGNTDTLNVKIENVEEKINTLQKEMTNLIGMLSNISKSTSSAMSKKQEPQTEAIAPASIMPGQSGRFVILHCKQWLDFQALALNAQTVSFTCKEAEKVFKAEALKRNQLILFSGALFALRPRWKRGALSDRSLPALASRWNPSKDSHLRQPRERASCASPPWRRNNAANPTGASGTPLY